MQSPCISQQFADKFLLLVVSVTDLVFCETRHYTEEVPEFLEAFGKFLKGLSVRLSWTLKVQRLSAAPGHQNEPGRRSSFKLEKLKAGYFLGNTVSFIAFPTRNLRVVFAGI